MAEPLAFAIDLGGTQLRAALVDAAGRVLRREAVRSDAEGGPEAVMAQVEALFAALSRGARVAALGASVPGPLDTVAGVVLAGLRIKGWEGVALRDRLRDRFGLPAALENDAVAAAVGEWRFGAGRGHDHLVYVTVSTGLGGGVISDGRVVRGRRGMAGHLGHILIDESSGAVCACGQVGHWEALACGSALDARVRAAAEGPDGGALRDAAGDGPAGGRALFAAAEAGDPLALRLVEEEARHLGRGFASLLHAFSPDLLVMGGGVAGGFRHLEPGIRDELARRAMPAFRDVPVVPAALGGDSGLVGAAALAHDLLRAGALPGGGAPAAAPGRGAGGS